MAEVGAAGVAGIVAQGTAVPAAVLGSSRLSVTKGMNIQKKF